MTGDGLSPSKPLGKISDLVKDTTNNVKNTGGMVMHNIKDACDMVGECVRENGAKVVKKVESIADIITKAKCVIPKNADNILRAALLQQCISPGLGKRFKELLIYDNNGFYRGLIFFFKTSITF